MIVAISTKCPQCKKVSTIEAEEADIKAWKAGAYIQAVMPYLNADQREQLKTGICPECWNRIFGKTEVEF